MSNQNQVKAKEEELSSKKRRSLFWEVTRRLVLFCVLVVMCFGVWSICHFREVISLAHTAQMKVFLLICYGIVAQMFAVVVWDMVFPKMITCYERLSFYLFFVGMFMCLGCAMFVLFLFVSVGFWAEDFFSSRIFAPMIGGLLFCSFFHKLMVFFR